MKTQQEFTDELRRQITRLCRTSKEGYKSSAAERHRLEGFIRAGVFMGLTSNAEAQKLLEDTYFAIMGQPLSAASQRPAGTAASAMPDYSQFDTPTYLRS